MSLSDKIADKIPDVYFDWYARLIPGLAASGAYLFKATPDVLSLAIEHTVIVFFIAYLVGYFIQPISSSIVKRFEYAYGGEKALEEHKRSGISKDSLETKASKAHAEAVSMMSAALLIFVVTIYYLIKSCDWDFVYLGLVVFLLISAFLSIRSRKRKIAVLIESQLTRES
jgi:hypothetical protein